MTTDFEVPRHPIGVAAERTGLSTDVIRAWERRYGAVSPARDDAGQRLYTDGELERLRLLRRATEAGRAIRQVATLEPDALAELVRGDEAARADRMPAGTVDLDVLVERALSLDGTALESLLQRSLLELGLVEFAEGVAAPLLHRLGDGWHAGEVSPAQEHVASVAVARVLESIRDGLSDGPVAAVCTVADDHHEAGALMVAAAVELAGWQVVYLGPDLPADDVAAAAGQVGARAVCVSAVYAASPGALQAWFRRLRAELTDEVEVYAGGSAALAVCEELELFGVRLPDGVTGLREALERHARG